MELLAYIVTGAISFVVGALLTGFAYSAQQVKDLASKDRAIAELEKAIIRMNSQIAIWENELSIEERIKQEVARATHE